MNIPKSICTGQCLCCHPIAQQTMNKIHVICIASVVSANMGTLAVSANMDAHGFQGVEDNGVFLQANVSFDKTMKLYQNVRYKYGEEDSNGCPIGTVRITDPGKCRYAAQHLNRSPWVGQIKSTIEPKGCVQRPYDVGAGMVVGVGVFYNAIEPDGKPKNGVRLICEFPTTEH